MYIFVASDILNSWRGITQSIFIQSSKSFKHMPPFFLCKAKLFAFFFNTILGLMTDVNFLWWRQEETANFFFSSITSRWIVSPKFLTFVSSNLLNFNTFCFNFKKSKPLSWVFRLWLKFLLPSYTTIHTFEKYWLSISGNSISKILILPMIYYPNLYS